MTKADFIFLQALLEAIPSTYGLPKKDRANIIRGRVIGSALYSDLEALYNSLMNIDDVKDLDSLDQHNKVLFEFNSKIMSEPAGVEPVKISETAFEMLCARIKDPVQLNLITSTLDVNPEDFLAYIYANLVLE